MKKKKIITNIREEIFYIHISTRYMGNRLDLIYNSELSFKVSQYSKIVSKKVLTWDKMRDDQTRVGGSNGCIITGTNTIIECQQSDVCNFSLGWPHLLVDYIITLFMFEQTQFGILHTISNVNTDRKNCLLFTFFLHSYN